MLILFTGVSVPAPISIRKTQPLLPGGKILVFFGKCSSCLDQSILFLLWTIVVSSSISEKSITGKIVLFYNRFRASHMNMASFLASDKNAFEYYYDHVRGFVLFEGKFSPNSYLFRQIQIAMPFCDYFTQNSFETSSSKQFGLKNPGKNFFFTHADCGIFRFLHAVAVCGVAESLWSALVTKTHMAMSVKSILY